MLVLFKCNVWYRVICECDIGATLSGDTRMMRLVSFRSRPARPPATPSASSVPWAPLFPLAPSATDNCKCLACQALTLGAGNRSGRRVRTFKTLQYLLSIIGGFFSNWLNTIQSKTDGTTFYKPNTFWPFLSFVEFFILGGNNRHAFFIHFVGYKIWGAIDFLNSQKRCLFTLENPTG